MTGLCDNIRKSEWPNVENPHISAGIQQTGKCLSISALRWRKVRSFKILMCLQYTLLAHCPCPPVIYQQPSMWLNCNLKCLIAHI
jgi:hypothetical protein